DHPSDEGAARGRVRLRAEGHNPTQGERRDGGLVPRRPPSEFRRRTPCYGLIVGSTVPLPAARCCGIGWSGWTRCDTPPCHCRRAGAFAAEIPAGGAPDAGALVRGAHTARLLRHRIPTAAAVCRAALPADRR